MTAGYEPGSVLGSRRARQIATIGGDMARGGLMSEELLELALGALADWAARYSEDLGEGVKRHLQVAETDEDHVDLTVTLSPTVGGGEELVAAFRLTLRVEGLIDGR